MEGTSPVLSQQQISDRWDMLAGTDVPGTIELVSLDMLADQINSHVPLSTTYGSMWSHGQNVFLGYGHPMMRFLISYECWDAYRHGSMAFIDKGAKCATVAPPSAMAFSMAWRRVQLSSSSRNRNMESTWNQHISTWAGASSSTIITHQ